MGNKGSSTRGKQGSSKKQSLNKTKSNESQQGTFADLYDIEDELGTGAYSKVIRCTCKDTGEHWAAKCVDRLALQPEDLKALEDEIAIMKELDHEHIIKLRDVFQEEKKTILILELVIGGELFDRIVKKSSYTEKEARDLVALLLRTVGYLHEHDIVHRDLKPENLLLTSKDDDANIKIADFGFARHISKVQELEEACGTPGYVAPEILRGLKYSGKADVWSIGVITYILLGGYPPFYDEDQDQLFRKIRRGQFEFHSPYWDHVSEEAKAIISEMLVVNHKARKSCQDLLEHDWIKTHDTELENRDISNTLSELKKFNAKRKLRSAMDTVIAVNRFRRLSTLASKSKSLDASDTSVSTIESEDKPTGTKQDTNQKLAQESLEDGEA
mmetsp:Transcript_33392/g.42038  ORF Transcript_33392/g.42038 Transcript_33392/m.42038 type:complete len:386 (+) Transcript_33392:69-1226(+)